MKKYTARKGDKVLADGKAGTFTVLKASARRATADLELIGQVAGNRYVVKGIPFAHIRPIDDREESSQAAARITKEARDKA